MNSDRSREAGFTLIELMIVIAIIAIVAAISIPNLLSAKTNANETSAIASLRNLASAQAQIAVAGKIDTDADGKGEHGTFLEMSGAVQLRKGYTSGSPSSSDFSTKGEYLKPAVLSSTMANVDSNGFATKSGYAFMIFLPDASVPAAWVHETGPAASAAFDGGSGTVGVDLSETVWCAYSQPVQYGGTGTRRFFINQKGDIMQSSNEVAKGQGTTTVVDGDAAFTGASITSAVAIGTTGNDGDIWRVTN